MDFGERTTRRSFLHDMGRVATGAAVAGSSLRWSVPGEAPKAPDLVVAHGNNAAAIVKKAVELLGGMRRFVSKGDVVVVKPNIGWDRLPRQAANTNPDTVVALVELALQAGAKQVKVFDNPVIDDTRAAYQRSGIAEAAEKAGAQVKFPDNRLFKDIELKGEFLKRWPVYTEALDCDCLINVPIAKQHAMARLTMALKNHMGIVGGGRGEWHRSLDVALAEFAAFIKPKVKLTVLDAYRILVRNGPTGGAAKDVEMPRKCIAGVDQVAVDAYGASLFKDPSGAPLKPTELGYLVRAKEMGIGQTDLSKLVIQEVEVA
jgi:uncharacterized protein (DUF362 family)